MRQISWTNQRMRAGAIRGAAVFLVVLPFDPDRLLDAGANRTPGGKNAHSPLPVLRRISRPRVRVPVRPGLNSSASRSANSR